MHPDCLNQYLKHNLRLTFIILYNWFDKSPNPIFNCIVKKNSGDTLITRSERNERRGDRKENRAMKRERRSCWEKGEDGRENGVDGQKKWRFILEICYEEQKFQTAKVIIYPFILFRCITRLHRINFFLKGWLPLASSDLR